MPYAIEGLEKTLKGLRKFSPELYKEMNNEIKPELKMIVNKAKDKLRPSILGLGNFGVYTNKSGKVPNRKFPIYNVEEARKGVTYTIGKTPRNYGGWVNRYLIWNKSRAGAIIETAGRKNPDGRLGVNRSRDFINKMDNVEEFKHVGQGRKHQGRIIFAAVEENQGRAKKAIEDAVIKAVNKFNAGSLK